MLTTTPGNAPSCAKLRADESGPDGAGNTVYPGPDPWIGGAMEKSSRPRTMAEVIGPDHAAFLARVTGLPYTYVATKLAEARARLDSEVA